MLGVVTFDTTLFGPASTLGAVQRSAHSAGYAVMVVSLPELDRESVARAVEQLRTYGVEGTLVIAPHEAATSTLEELTHYGPLVAVEAGAAVGVPVVSVDQFQGAFTATSHLLELGHATVWHVAGPLDWLGAQQRIEGWQAAVVAAGADVPALHVGDWSPRSGYEAGRMLAADPSVTAIFAANDPMAFGVARALREAGRGVPADVSLVGFDDMPEAEFFNPPLTTVRQSFAEVGQTSVNLLLSLMHGDEPVRDCAKIVPELVIRSSTRLLRKPASARPARRAVAAPSTPARPRR
jgi:DNA-binding LacI/PurR family transcriptional regulator